MKLLRNIALGALFGSFVIGGGYAVMTRGTSDPLPEVSTTVSDSGVQLLFAQPFRLDEGYTHWFRADRPTVSSGYLIAVACDSDLVYPRQGYQAVLYAGEQTVDRLNVGFVPGEIGDGQPAYVVGLVPAPVDASGEVALDWATTPIWFGTPELPERVDAATIAQEVALAKRDGIGPRPHREVKAALRNGGGTLYAADHLELLRHAADVIERYSPLEVDVVEGYRLPPPEHAIVRHH